MHAIGPTIKNVEHGFPAQPTRCRVLREASSNSSSVGLRAPCNESSSFRYAFDNCEIPPRLVLAAKRGFLRIALAQATLHRFLVCRNPAVQHVAFRQIELVYRIFHRKAHGAMILGAQVVRLEKPLVPLCGRIDGIEVRLNEALPREAAAFASSARFTSALLSSQSSAVRGVPLIRFSAITRACSRPSCSSASEYGRPPHSEPCFPKAPRCLR